MANLIQKAKRVRNFPLLAIRVLQEMMPGGFLSSTNHIKKQNLIKQIQKEKGYRTFVETGTNEGAMIEAVKNCFEQIYSIELDMDLYRKAQGRFSSEKHVHIFQGDSGTVLKTTLDSIAMPSLFWLDAHYSGGVTAKADSETPVLQELNLIFDHPAKGHTVVIDDAWSFGTIKDYPSIFELKRFVKTKSPLAKVAIKKGIIILNT